MLGTLGSMFNAEIRVDLSAVRHNVAGGWLEVCTGPVGGGEAGEGGAEGAELRVASSGPEVPPDRVDEMTGLIIV